MTLQGAIGEIGMTTFGFARTILATIIGLTVFALGADPARAQRWQTVRIGVDATYPPFESVNPQGEIVGWEVEYTKALCAEMKVTCTFQNQDWDGIIPSLIAGKFDTVLSSMNVTPARAKLVEFSTVYYATPPAFFGAAGGDDKDVSPETLKGKSIGAQSSTTFANFLEQFYKDSNIKVYPGGDEPMIDLKAGRLDYVLIDLIVGLDFIDKSGAGCCRMVTTIKRNPDIFGPGVGAAFRKEDGDLRDMFNKAIATLNANGTFKTIADKYFKFDIRP
jgi:polar amino acid transport system substrate-binding protein